MQDASFEPMSHKLLAGAAALVLTILIGCVMATPAYADTAAEKQAEAQSVLNQINGMQQVLDETSTQYFDAIMEQQQAEENRDAAAARITEIDGEIDDIQSHLGNRAREMYRNGNTTVLDLLLGSATFEEFTQSWDLLNKLNQNDADMIQQAKALKTESEHEKEVYTEQAAIADQKANEAAEAYNQAQETMAQMEATYNSLSAEAQELIAQERAAQYAAQGTYTATTGGVVNDDGTVTDISTGEVYSSASEYSAVTGNAIVDRAMSALGSAYSWGGVGADGGGYDCSGLVSYALTGEHTRLGTTTTFMGWNQVSDPQPGDVCVNEGHTGIYIGNGQMIHASDYGTGVIIGPVQSGMIYVRQ